MQIDDLFREAVKRKASDLHLAIGLPPTLRIDGELMPLKETGVVSATKAEEMIFGILRRDQKEKLLAERELDTSYALDGVARFRVNCHFEKGVLGMVARVVSSQIPTMSEIEMPETTYGFARRRAGLVLITGPAGCGKSTALAAMIDLINSERTSHIITLEDPIEYIFTPKKSIIKQRELGSDILTFASGLKHALRQDPNVIMVGEMRDLETIGSAITLAETGHLVLATLHTYNAAQTIDRIIDVFPAYQQAQIRLQLSITLAGIMSQQLLPRIGGSRIAARELLVNTPAISNLIRENKVPQIKTVIQTSAKEGMQTLDQDLIRLFKNNKITKEVAQAHMFNPEMLE